MLGLRCRRTLPCVVLPPSRASGAPILRHHADSGALTAIGGCDLNLTAIGFEGPHPPATPNHTLTYTDGVPTSSSPQAQTPS